MVSVDKILNVVIGEKALCPHADYFVHNINEEHIVSALLGLFHASNDEAGFHGRIVKEIRPKTQHTFNDIKGNQIFAHRLNLGFHTLDDVLPEGIVAPLGIAEDAVQGVRVSRLDVTRGLLERMADIVPLGPDGFPVAAIRNLETVVFGELGKFYVATRLFHGHGIFLVIDIGDLLEEQQRENVGFEIGCVD